MEITDPILFEVLASKPLAERCASRAATSGQTRTARAARASARARAAPLAGATPKSRKTLDPGSNRRPFPRVGSSAFHYLDFTRPRRAPRQPTAGPRPSRRVALRGAAQRADVAPLRLAAASRALFVMPDRTREILGASLTVLALVVALLV